ncbi:MAG: hypothetical protein KF799_00490 [Bdellovibrionales bacterium]|nr:hypothetical protein [Bdellovibrionales bacterium]
MKLIFTLVFLFSAQAQAQVEAYPAFDTKKILAMKSLPEGTITHIRGGKTIYQGALRGLKGLKGGDIVKLSKGFHLIPKVYSTMGGKQFQDKFEFSQSAHERDERPIVYEGSGIETILVEEDFFKEKREPIQAMVRAGGSGSARFSKMTFVNTKWWSNASREFFAGVRFDDVRFEKGFETDGRGGSFDQMATWVCYFCVFDQAYPMLKEPLNVNVGSLIFNPEKGYLLRKRLYSGNLELEEFVDNLSAARRKKGDFAKVTDKEARDLFLSLGAFESEKFKRLFTSKDNDYDTVASTLTNQPVDFSEFLRAYLIRNYKFTVPPNPVVTRLVAQAESMMSKGHPLTAFMTLRQLPRDIEDSAVKRVEALRAKVNQSLTKNYRTCFIDATSVVEEDSWNRIQRGLPLKAEFDLHMKRNLEEKYPVLMLSDPKSCRMEVQFTRNKLDSRTDDSERYIVVDQEVDWGAVQEQAEARASAMLAASQNIATMTRNLGNNMEKMWRREIDKSTHFQKHVGGTDLVSWKMDRSTKNSVTDGVVMGKMAPSGMPIKTTYREERRVRRIASTDLQASVKIHADGKVNTFPLERWTAQYTVGECTEKFSKTNSTGAKLEAEKKETCTHTMGNSRVNDIQRYVARAVVPTVDGYVTDLMMPRFADAAVKAGKNKTLESRVEASLLAMLFKVDVPAEDLAEIEKVTGLKDPKTSVLAAVRANYERIAAEVAGNSSMQPRIPEWEPAHLCRMVPSTIGSKPYEGLDPHGRMEHACWALHWDTLTKFEAKASGSTKFSCAAKRSDGLISETSITVDFDAGGETVEIQSKLNPAKNRSRTLAEWNQEFGPLLDIPFGKDAVGKQFAYILGQDQQLVQLELESSTGKTRIKDGLCGRCYPQNPRFAKDQDTKSESFRQACVRYAGMVEPVRTPTATSAGEQQ